MQNQNGKITSLRAHRSNQTANINGTGDSKSVKHMAIPPIWSHFEDSHINTSGIWMHFLKKFIIKSIR